MTHRGPFQPLLFCDSVILLQASKQKSNCELQSDGREDVKHQHYNPEAVM